MTDLIVCCVALVCSRDNNLLRESTDGNFQRDIFMKISKKEVCAFFGGVRGRRVFGGVN